MRYRKRKIKFCALSSLFSKSFCKSENDEEWQVLLCYRTLMPTQLKCALNLHLIFSKKVLIGQ